MARARKHALDAPPEATRILERHPAGLRPRAAGKRLVVVPDGQCSKRVPFEHWFALGRYIVKLQPDRVLYLGDLCDAEAFSTHESAAVRAADQRRWLEDLEAMDDALALVELGSGGYRPPEGTDLIAGNHEYRFDRYIAEHPELAGVVRSPYEIAAGRGLRIFPFGRRWEWSGILAKHYWALTAAGKPTARDSGAGASAAAQLKYAAGRSILAGHTAGLELVQGRYEHGIVWSVVAGSFFQHDERWRKTEDQHFWRGIVVLNDVRPGGLCDPMPVGLDWLLRKYGPRRGQR